MSTIFGIIDKQGHSFDNAWLEGMKADLSHGRPDRADTWHNKMAGLGNLLVFNTPESLSEILPFRDKESGLLICSDSRIDNREEVAGQLHISGSALKLLSDSELILKTFQKWGHDSPKYLRGDFSFAVYNEREHQLFLARDHFGIRPLFYYDHPRYFVFSSELRGILALPFFEKELNTGWLLDFLINTPRVEYDTFYKGICSLPPGHNLVLKNGKIVIHKYWELKIPEKLILKTDAEYIEVYKTLFDRAVKNRCRSAFPVGAELSGGLDSSSIAAMAQKYLKTERKQLHVFARVLPETKIPEQEDASEDESAEIGLVCDFCGISNIHIVTLEGQKITENIGQMIDITQTPQNSNYAVYNLNAHLYARSAGVRTVLSGHGGDQMLTSQAVFVYHNYLRDHRYFKLINDIRARHTPNELPWLKTLMYLYKLNRKDNSFKEKRTEIKKLYKFGLNPEFISRYHLKERYLQHRAETVYAPEGINDLILKTTHRHMNDRIEVTGLLAGHENIEFRYPMFDVDLIEYYLSVPDHMKRKFRIGRYLHRMAMQGELPAVIQWRTDKHVTINPGLELLFENDAETIKSTFFTVYNDRDNELFSLIFNPKTLTYLVNLDDNTIFEHKSVVIKYSQLCHFKKIISNMLV